MPTRRLLRAAAIVSVGALLTFSAASAQADDVSNNLDAGIDAVAEVMALNTGGEDGTTTLYVTPRNGDGKNGCNLTGSTILTISLASSDTAVATVSPSSATFSSCEDTATVTVTPVAQGSASVTATQTANTTDGTFNLAPATFTVNVAPPANTAPSIAVAGVTGGATYIKGSIPAATCQVTDAEDGPSTSDAILSAITGPDAAGGIGSQTASCSYADAGGLVTSASETYTIADGTAPVITYTLDPAAPDGLNGWYTSDVSLDWTVTEADSTSTLVTVGCADVTVTADQLATAYTCSASSAGGSADEVSVSIQRDATAPSVEYTSASPAANAAGWHKSPVTATFTATDVTSGPAVATKTATSTAEGTAVVVSSPAFADDAGNTTAAGAASQSFKIDLTDPTATFDGIIGDVYFGSVPPSPSCTATDGLSGPAACVVSGWSSSVGTHQLTATAYDNAGRTGTATQSYTVMAWTARGFYQPVDMNGTLNTVKGGSTVPVKFELFAGATELTDTNLVAMSAKKVSCTTSTVTDEIELTTTGATSLRYDTTAGQFIYNWKTPTGAGTCYQLTMTADDGSTLSASFKLK